MVGYFESLQYELRRSAIHIGMIQSWVHKHCRHSEQPGSKWSTHSKKQYSARKRNASNKIRPKICTNFRVKSGLEDTCLLADMKFYAVPFKRLLPGLFFTVLRKTDRCHETKEKLAVIFEFIIYTPWHKE